MITRILVAIDFSEASLNALETAICMAEKNGASICLVHAQDNIFDFLGISTTSMTSVTFNSFSILSALATDIHKRTGIKPVIIEENGYVTEIIIKNAVKYRCELITMGTYGASGYRKGYLGSTAYGTVKYAPCPVLLVPAGKKWTSFRRPLFPVRPISTALRYFEIVRNFLEDDFIPTVLGLYNVENDSVEDLSGLISDIEGRLAAKKIAAKTVWGTEHSISKDILLQAEKANSDLVIVTPSIDVSAKTFYIGPNTHGIIHNAKTPVLFINKVNVYALSGSR
jgi:nucleotide-binding universal stress UspA family protein